MKYLFFIYLTLFSTAREHVSSAECGCKYMHPCYEQMLKGLREQDEANCVIDASIGSGMITIYLKALTKYCSEFISVTTEHFTYGGRSLYEVVIEKKDKEQAEERPTFIIEGGQEAGTDSVGLALFVIEQLVACGEYREMIDNVRWVILPSTNPDGLETSINKNWRKNFRPIKNRISYGVDVSRNFDTEWSSCPKADSSFSQIYKGPKAASENETIFIKHVIEKYKKSTKIYLSLRRNGHSIGYPYAYSKTSPTDTKLLIKVAEEVALRVNQRTSGVHFFANNSIYKLEGRPYCGHSVDYAFDNGIPLAFEMRVFLESDNKIMSRFQELPRGYESSLRNGYFNGIRELYNVITNKKKYGSFKK